MCCGRCSWVSQTVSRLLTRLSKLAVHSPAYTASAGGTYDHNRYGRQVLSNVRCVHDGRSQDSCVLIDGDLFACCDDTIQTEILQIMNELGMVFVGFTPDGLTCYLDPARLAYHIATNSA